VKKPLGIACALAVLFSCAAGPLFAADGEKAQPSQYSLGDQTMTISAGLFVPLFLLPTGTWLLAPSAGPGSPPPPHLSLGGVGSLAWAAYVTPQIRVGAEVGGDFTLSVNMKTLFMLPILARASYSFTAFPFEIPLSFALGMNIVKYVDMTAIDLLLRPGASIYWIYSTSWSFGLNFNYWFDIQFNGTTPANARIGNFLEISLSLLYHW
jgi:hypothetical protein